MPLLHTPSAHVLCIMLPSVIMLSSVVIVNFLFHFHVWHYATMCSDSTPERPRRCLTQPFTDSTSRRESFHVWLLRVSMQSHHDETRFVSTVFYGGTMWRSPDNTAIDGFNVRRGTSPFTDSTFNDDHHLPIIREQDSFSRFSMAGLWGGLPKDPQDNSQ